MRTNLCAFVLLAAGPLVAQQPAGLLTGMPPAGVAMVTLAPSIGSEMMARIPGEAYRGLGAFAPPASFALRGVVLRLRDAAPAFAESFDLHVYLEAGATNLPTIPPAAAPGTTAIVSVTGVAVSAGSTSHEIVVVFPNPVDVPVGSDLFVAFVPQTPGLGWRAISGTSLQGLTGSAVDSCGPALPLGATFALQHDNGVISPLSTSTVGWQFLVDLLVDGSSGVAVNSVDGTSPPTASFYSGLHPDVASPSHHAGRHDTPGYLFRGNGVLAAGSPVFLLASLGPFAAPPWLVIVPGDAVLLLPLAGAFPSASGVVSANGNAPLMWPVPQHSGLRGVDVFSQAFGFDLGQGAVRAGAAVRQRL